MTGVLELVLAMRLPILQQFGGVREILTCVILILLFSAV
jgi:hypothetical protein